MRARPMARPPQVVALVHTFARVRLAAGQPARCLVLAPCSLVANWRDEFAKVGPALGRFLGQLRHNQPCLDIDFLLSCTL
jgi:hypothetical protein